MTSPPPAPFTSDEHEVEPEPSPLAALRLMATARRWLALLGTLVIALAMAGLSGYAVGRRSVLPHPGEEARLDSVKASLAHTADSLRQVGDWEHAQRMVLLQKQAAGPQVEVIGPGKARIVSRNPAVIPRVVEIPAEVTAALVNERALNASLRVELAAREGEAAAERARADSAERTTQLARAERVDWLSGGLTGGYDPLLGAWAAQADAGLRLSDDWSLHAAIDQRFRKGEKPRGLIGLRWGF